MRAAYSISNTAVECANARDFACPQNTASERATCRLERQWSLGWARTKVGGGAVPWTTEWRTQCNSPHDSDMRPESRLRLAG